MTSHEDAWLEVEALKKALGFALDMIDDLLPLAPNPHVAAVVYANVAHARALLRKFGPPDTHHQPESRPT